SKGSLRHCFYFLDERFHLPLLRNLGKSTGCKNNRSLTRADGNVYPLCRSCKSCAPGERDIYSPPIAKKITSRALAIGSMASNDEFQTAKTPLVKQLAHWVIDFDPRSIPEDVASHAKLLILDSIGCALSAREEHAYRRALRTFDALGGKPECAIIGSRRRMPVTNAVMLNGI